MPGDANLGVNRFDLPVLTGFKLDIFRIYASPVMSWNLGTLVDWDDVDIVVNEAMSVELSWRWCRVRIYNL